MTSSTGSIEKPGPVGLIGVGTMGRRMLELLMQAGFAVIAYDPMPAAGTFILEQHAELAADPRGVAEKAKLILMSLPSPRQVAETLDALGDAIGPGHVLVDTSTVSPDTSRNASARAASSGARYVDAPVLGRPASAGNWLLPAGGPSDAVEFARPALLTFAKSVIRVGDTGTGNAFKLLNQLMFSVINGISAEVMALTDVLGIDRKTFYEVIANSGAATVSGLFRETAGRIADDRYDSPTFTVELLCKDAGLGIQMAKDAGVTPLIAGFVQSINENAKGKGLAKLDTSSLAMVFGQLYAKFDSAPGGKS